MTSGTPPSPADGDGLLTQDEQAIMRRVERSRVWRLLRDAMGWEREELLRQEPQDDRQLWKTWGKIELLGRLLQDSPRNVIWYTRFMKQREEEAVLPASKQAPEPERTFDPDGFPEKPQFDM